MINIVCIDDDGGMMFNNRRQSMDSKVRADMCRMVGDSRLWMNDYSKKQFEDTFENIVVDEEFYNKAGQGEYCFVENPQHLKVLNMEQLIIYKWNRRYPSDERFNINISGMKLVGISEFAGSSHERIIKEVWE